MKKSTVTGKAVRSCIKFMEDFQNSELSITEMEKFVRRETAKELKVSTITDELWDWTAITRKFISTVTTTPTYFGSFRKFCSVNPSIVSELRTICGTLTHDGNEYSFLDYQVTLMVHLSVVLSKRTDNLTRKEIVNLITKEVNSFYGSSISAPLTTNTVKTMLPSIVLIGSEILTTMDSNVLEDYLLLSNSPWNSIESLFDYYNDYSTSIWNVVPTNVAVI